MSLKCILELNWRKQIYQIGLLSISGGVLHKQELILVGFQTKEYQKNQQLKEQAIFKKQNVQLQKRQEQVNVLVHLHHFILKKNLIFNIKKIFLVKKEKLLQMELVQFQKIQSNKYARNLIQIQPHAFKLDLLGSKGVLMQMKFIEKNTIILRNSMKKFDVLNEGDKLYIDILDMNKYRNGYLNRQVIILLKSLGIQDKIFRDLQNEFLQMLEKEGFKDANFYNLFNVDFEENLVEKNIEKLDRITVLLKKMYDEQLYRKKDPFIDGVLNSLKYRGYYILKKKCNIYVEKSARLLGILDEFNLLEENQVYANYSKDGELFQEIEGKVIVVKNPCLHPGDIRILNAVSTKNDKKYNFLKEYKNVLIFPKKGKIPIAAQIAGSDLDGDQYFICWDERLIPNKEVIPFDYDQENNKNIQQNLQNQINDQQMLDFFIDFINCENLGKIDNSHLAIADQSSFFALDFRCIQLAKLHAQAVDYAKTGVSPYVPLNLQSKQFPDYMEKSDKNQYESKSVLGYLYRQVKGLSKHKPFFQKKAVFLNLNQKVINEDLLFKFFDENKIDFKKEIEYVKNIYQIYSIKYIHVRHQIQYYNIMMN
ncbi:RNA-dependent rna polymerase, putative [Ichthyophthirius multifiliis]|uniref:RNA-dependent RNA polymerase n=1 Tax=Ichthyophthirius multifiliis TaxID=5932 RepID=G0QT14_ICHMU|nr:RNA-dependent rna polymerase, putative [Ichthyophthirius multifiliis]EGR31631.1 RNA-dependent rna polymerase, putative [Ichthyophthirius multifiliis]|eukprot:XP_004035117.1 RNA-dependent rna polymerase, putative [Ichthyophthirius multifiliis]